MTEDYVLAMHKPHPAIQCFDTEKLRREIRKAFTHYSLLYYPIKKFELMYGINGQAQITDEGLGALCRMIGCYGRFEADHDGSIRGVIFMAQVSEEY